VNIPYTSSDIWVLLAVAYSTAGGRAALAEIIGTGDAINKAIFTSQELRRGFARLTAGGLVSDSDGRFDLTDAGRALIQAARARGARNPLEEWLKLDELLSTDQGARNHPQFEDPVWPYPSLNDAAIDAAMDGYQRAARQIMKELGLPVDDV